MQKNDLLQASETIYRLLDLTEEKALVIDCVKQTMPKWVDRSMLSGASETDAEDLQERAGIRLYDYENASQAIRKAIRERFTLIAGVLPFVSDAGQRSNAINRIAEQYNVSKQTIRHYLCLYLAFQDMSALAFNEIPKRELTEVEKNMRWGLNKFFYTKNKNSLATAYAYMLKAKYCDALGNLIEPYPTFNQFRYFYRKTKNLQKFYISRNGIKDYQKNHRPLLGDGIQEYASTVGMGMLDATICDIYLVNEDGGVIGRPVLTACIDPYSSICMGYCLTWEGGVYSLKDLLLHVITDKVLWCRSFGIEINNEDWDCSSLPSALVTDMGTEYTSCNFEQIAELGVKIINLPAYRPELKGSVEKFFDLVQSSFKQVLKGKGVIEVDFQERGAHDYRKDACLTMREFEKIIIYCILYYNTKRVTENYPFTEDMITAKVKPFAADIWRYGKKQIGASLIEAGAEQLIKTLLPRANGRFTRQGLKVNGLRYRNDNYIDKYLSGGDVLVAYNPDDVSAVWLIERHNYVLFTLIENRYNGKCLLEVQTIKQKQKSMIENHAAESLQGKIDLIKHLETIAETGSLKGDSNLRSIRSNRQKEKQRTHRDHMRELEKNG